MFPLPNYTAPHAIRSYTDTGCHERLKYFIFLGNFAVICNVRNEANCTKNKSIKTNTKKKQLRNSFKCHKHKHNRTNGRLGSPLGDVNEKRVGIDIIVETV